MPNLTLKVDDDVIKKARKIAIDKNTTLTAMIRDYLNDLVGRGEIEKMRAIKELKATFGRYSRDMGPRTWTREGLHER